jgi:hypothetical protein
MSDEQAPQFEKFTLWGEEPRGNGLSVITENVMSWDVVDGVWCVVTHEHVVQMIPFRNWLRLVMVPDTAESPL